MPDRPVTWIAEAVELAIHDEQLAEHGGLAASYAFGIPRNRPFVDGNERTALVVAETVLLLNDYVLGATDADCVSTFLALAAGELAEQDLAAWTSEHIEASRK